MTCDPLELTTAQRFEVERWSRAIDSTSDVDTLRGLCKQLLRCWHMQKAATAWTMRQRLQSMSRQPLSGPKVPD